MDVFQAIKGRRSIGVVKSKMPPRELIERLLDAAVWAPTHHHTEPWRFFVLTGEARNRLGEAMAQIVAAQLDDSTSEEAHKRLERERQKPLRAPVVIAVAASLSDQPNLPEIEEIEAVACAVQNMMLAAHALGLGTVWRTGEITYEPALRSFFGLGERDRLLGFVYVGYPDMPQREGKRTPFSQKTVWWDA